jgi:hypothetical protein
MRRILMMLFVVAGIILVLLLYIFVGTVTGTFEDQALKKVKRHRINGTTLEALVSQRIRYNNEAAIPDWKCSDFSSHVIVQACVGNWSAQCCAVFWSSTDGQRVVPKNKLATRLVPELKPDPVVGPADADFVDVECLCSRINGK